MSRHDPGSSNAEQRRHRRVGYRDPVQVTPIGAAFAQHPRALLAEDLSAAGLQLTSPEVFKVGARLLMALEPPELAAAPLSLVGTVIWVAQDGAQERYRLGVAFEDLGDAAREQLRRLMRKRGRA